MSGGRGDGDFPSHDGAARVRVAPEPRGVLLSALDADRIQGTHQVRDAVILPLELLLRSGRWCVRVSTCVIARRGNARASRTLSCAFSSKAWSRSARSAIGSLPSLRISSARARHRSHGGTLFSRRGVIPVCTSQLLQPRESRALLLVDGASHRVGGIGRAGLRAALEALDATEQRLERERERAARSPRARVAARRARDAFSRSPPCATQPHWRAPQNPVRGRARESRRAGGAPTLVSHHLAGSATGQSSTQTT